MSINERCIICYKPARRAVDLSEAAERAAKNGNIEGAKRLLAVARKSLGRVANLTYTDGTRVGQHYNDALKVLTEAERYYK